MAVTLSSLAGAGAQFFDNNGVPLAGGLIYTYVAGTTTPAATYTSSTGVTAHANPIVLDAAGRIATGEVWLTSGVEYKFIVQTSLFVQLGSYDNIPSINDFTSIYAALANTTNAALGDALVGFKQSDSSGVLAGAVGRTVHQKLQQTLSVEDFGAICNGIADDTTAIQTALTYAYSIGGAVVTANGTCKVSSDVLVKANVTFNFNKLIPATASTSVMRVYGGASIKGTIDTSAFPAYSVKALIIDGAGEVNGSVFRLHIKTFVDVSVIGGGVTGTAIYFKATTTSARIMGVQLNARINKFKWGVYLEQTSADLSQFINSNYINIDSSDTIIAIEMVSSQANFYGIDGNNFIAKGQPIPSTVEPLYKLCGQDNIFDLLPFDWDAEFATAPFAGTIKQFSRRNVFYWRTDFNYLQNNSTDLGNFFFALFEKTIKVYSITGYANAAVMPIKDVSVRLDNNKFFSGSKADASNQLLLGVDTSNNTVLECASGGIYSFRINGTNRAFLTTTSFEPGSDNTQSLGASGNRWSVVYAATGAINTSDGTTKQQIRDLSEAEKAVALRCKGLLKAFKFNDSVETKADGARWHFGIVAQDVKAAFEAEDLNAEDYGVFCSDTLEDGSVRLGVRYDELFAFILGAM